MYLKRYKGKVKYWMTFNEINNQAELTAMGAHHLAQEGAVLVKRRAMILNTLMFHTIVPSMHHQLVASALAVKAAHEIDPDAKVGCMIGMATMGLSSNL